jgi:biotin operon repressor
MANEEIIGYHKGALATLSKERQELAKMVGIVDQFIKMHLDELKKLGVDLEEEAKKMQDTQKDQPKGNQGYPDEARMA